jgi:hypothetical protein
LTQFDACAGAFDAFDAFPFWEEKLVAALIAIPNVDKTNRIQEKGKKLN